MHVMTETNTINVKNVSVSFGNFLAVDNISVEIASGKIVGLIGPSGAGKTTLMRSIVGRQNISSGKITINGLQAGSKELRDDISYKTQEVSVYSDLTIKQNLSYFSTMMNVPRKETKTENEKLIDILGLNEQADQLAGSLSGGQKQRVSLAIALIGNPKILILDEPTVGLDPVLRDELWKMFRHLAENGATLLISSHVMDEAERCDDLILIREGQIVAHATPKDMLAQTGSQSVEESFLKLARDSNG